MLNISISGNFFNLNLFFTQIHINYKILASEINFYQKITN